MPHPMPRLRPVAAVLAAAALLAAAGCGANKCPTETPDVNDIGVCNSGLAAGQPVTVQLRICPTCNQTLPTCDADVQGNVIQLDPIVEACDSSNGCPPSCLTNSISCRFVAPAAPGDYQLQVFDPSTGGVITRSVTVLAGGGNSCALASGPL